VVRFLPFLISLVLTVYALFSCIQTPDEEVPHLPKLVWILLIVFVPFVGPIVWLLMSRTPAGRRDPDVRPQRPRPTAGRPLAPDDDPDFLKSLDRYRDPRTTSRPPERPADTDQPKDKPSKEPKRESERDPKKKDPEDSTSDTDDGLA
jgi:hypothetical protein